MHSSSSTATQIKVHWIVILFVRSSNRSYFLSMLCWSSSFRAGREVELSQQHQQIIVPLFNDPFLWRYKCTKCRKIICPNFKTFLTQMVTISGPLKWKSLTCLLFPKKTTTKVNKIESFSNSVQNYLTWPTLAFKNFDYNWGH